MEGKRQRGTTEKGMGKGGQRGAGGREEERENLLDSNRSTANNLVGNSGPTGTSLS